MSKKHKGYLGNSNLKEAGIKIDYTPEQVKEYIRCAKDPIYFIKNYIKIVSLDKGLVPFDLYDYQEDIVQKIHDNRFIIAKLPRQSGKSTTMVSYILHYILFNQSMNVAILANKGSTAREILSRLQLAYEYLPKWLQQGVVEWNKGSLKLENGSKIIASTTSASAVRGGSFNMIFLDEFAHVPNNVAEEFFSSVFPTVTSGQTTKVLMVSTPNGMNMFYHFWKNAIKKDGEPGKNEYVPIEVNWRQIPLYPGGPMRGPEWRQQMIDQTSELQFESEFECSFLGSSNTLISTYKLNTLIYNQPIERRPNGLSIYKQPDEDGTYFCVVDTSRGQGKDYSAFIIVNGNTKPYEVVAVYRNNVISPFDFPGEIYNALVEYGNAHCLVEVNDVGSQVTEILHRDFEYENMISTQYMGRAGQKISLGFGRGQKQIGVRTSTALKKIGCAALKNLVECNKIIFWDQDMVSEFYTFISKANSFSADDGYNDDLVMCMVLFGWLTRQNYFEDLLDLKSKKIINTAEDNQENHIFVIEDDETQNMKMGGDLWFEVN
jgi:hypothetical protein